MCYVHLGYWWVCWVCGHRDFEIVFEYLHKDTHSYLNIDCTCYERHWYVDCIKHKAEVRRADGQVVFGEQNPGTIWMRAHAECEDPLFDEMVRLHRHQVQMGRNPDDLVHPMDFHVRPDLGLGYKYVKRSEIRWEWAKDKTRLHTRRHGATHSPEGSVHSALEEQPESEVSVYHGKNPAKEGSWQGNAFRDDEAYLSTQLTPKQGGFIGDDPSGVINQVHLVRIRDRRDRQRELDRNARDAGVTAQVITDRMRRARRHGDSTREAARESMQERFREVWRNALADPIIPEDDTEVTEVSEPGRGGAAGEGRSLVSGLESGSFVSASRAESSFTGTSESHAESSFASTASTGGAWSRGQSDSGEDESSSDDDGEDDDALSRDGRSYFS